MEMIFGRSRYDINIEIGKQSECVQGNFLEPDYVKMAPASMPFKPGKSRNIL